MTLEEHSGSGNGAVVEAKVVVDDIATNVALPIKGRPSLDQVQFQAEIAHIARGSSARVTSKVPAQSLKLWLDRMPHAENYFLGSTTTAEHGRHLRVWHMTDDQRNAMAVEKAAKAAAKAASAPPQT